MGGGGGGGGGVGGGGGGRGSDEGEWGDWVREKGRVTSFRLSSGMPVMVVNGAYRGTRAILESIDVDNFCATVKIDQVCWYTIA
jgi:hypothetical protein